MPTVQKYLVSVWWMKASHAIEKRVKEQLRQCPWCDTGVLYRFYGTTEKDMLLDGKSGNLSRRDEISAKF